MTMEVIDLSGDAHTYDFRLLPGDLPRFWPRWEVMERGYVVLATYDESLAPSVYGWTITTYPGTDNYDTDDAAAASHIWRGGCAYVFEDKYNLKAALTTAGYDTTYSEAYRDRYVDFYGPSGGVDCS